jgi:Protein of unknown function (DUF4038)/Putative collagen-binding domain of a collagenase
MRQLRVSDNGRFLADDDGAPFFYLGDTAWELFHRLTYEESDIYLQDRAAKGFTVIQCVALAEFDGIHEPNHYGECPLLDDDPTRPNEPYWAHVDRIVARIGQLGMVAGLLPTWGDKWNKHWGVGPEIFTPANARLYGEWIARRYRDAALIWILGGDRPVQTEVHAATVRAMAEGIAAGDGGAHLRTFHPCGQQTSSQYFHGDSWLDFNMYQTGHTWDRDNWRSVAADYACAPAKPCLDAEPGYEGHPNAWKPETGYLDDYECRKWLWWALFAGACGHTYGCHDIWQFLDATRHAPVSAARTPWTTALHLPGASQMRHAKDLLLSHSYLSRIPDQSLIVSETYDDDLRRTHHIQATRDSGGSYALVYSASGQPFSVDMTKLSGAAEAGWLDPRNGKWDRFGSFPNTGAQEFTPPSRGRGNDWVLRLDTQ